MSVNTTNLLSGRAQLVPYANLTADRYQFLGLNQAEPSLGSGIQGNVLTLGVSNTRVWTADLNIVSANLSGDLSVTGNITAGNIIGNGNGSVTLGNLTISNTTISTKIANGNITLTSTGDQLVIITGNTGVVIPAGDTAQRPDPALVGTLRVNTALTQIEAWDGSAWISGSNTGNISITDQQITPDGSTITFTLDQDTNQDSILVSLNGVGQLPGVAYTVSGNTITFTQAPAPADIIDVRFLASAVATNKILNSSGNARVVAYDAPSINIEVGGSNVLVAGPNKIFNVSAAHSLQLPSYTVAQTANLTNVNTGQVIYVSDGDTGNPCLAVYSDGAFKRVSFGANIST